MRFVFVKTEDKRLSFSPELVQTAQKGAPHNQDMENLQPELASLWESAGLLVQSYFDSERQGEPS